MLALRLWWARRLMALAQWLAEKARDELARIEEQVRLS
jgi:hypothetical protein